MIKFKKVRFKNFGSFGNNWTEIDLDTNKTTLICGNNGSGKSFAFLDSITFALFGKPFRKINIPQLVNTINEKGCLVEITFSRGSDEFLVRRGISPRIFEIYKNNELLSQDSKSVDYQEILEQQILKMNYKTFTQVVILGSSSFVPFMQLSAADRRTVIENILDINIFTTMNVVLRGKILSLKETLKEINSKLEIERNKISVQKSYIMTLERKNEEDNDYKLDQIKELEEKIYHINNTILTLGYYPDDIDETISSIAKLKEKIKIGNIAMSDVLSENKTHEKQIQFFKQNDNCPVCHQEINNLLKKNKIIEYNLKLSDGNDALDRCKNHLADLETQLNTFENNLVRTKTLGSEHKAYTKEIEKYNKEIERIKSTLNKSAVADNLDMEKEILGVLEGGVKVLEEERANYSDELMHHELVSELLRDGGVKTKIIKYYLPHMNKFINKYLSSMDFFAQFNLDEEFNECIKSRYRDDFSYMNFSEGEKMRIDLALLLAWREVARLKNSINCNLLILDEVFDSSLDMGGIDELMKLLKIISDKTNVYVISHKADQLVDKFTNIISFEKKNNFSKMINN